MATARAMTVLSTQWPILGTQILQRRRSADLASLRSVYGEPALQAEEAMVPALQGRNGPRLPCSEFRSCLRFNAFRLR